MRDRDMKWANAVGEMVLVDYLDGELPHTFNLLKKKQKERKKSSIYEVQ